MADHSAELPLVTSSPNPTHRSITLWQTLAQGRACKLREVDRGSYRYEPRADGNVELLARWPTSTIMMEIARRPSSEGIRPRPMDG